MIDDADRGPAEVRTIVPRAATQNAASVGIVLLGGGKRVTAPLPNVPVHIMQTPRVRFLQADRMRLPAGEFKFFENLETAFDLYPMARFFLNTIIVATVSAIVFWALFMALSSRYSRSPPMPAARMMSCRSI